MTSYSDLFSSGLVPHTPRHRDYPEPPSPLLTDPMASSPMAIPPSPVDSVIPRSPIDRQTTPTPTSPTPRLSAIEPARYSKDKPVPRLRKRRSSLTPAAAPMPGVKSPARTARTSFTAMGSLMSPAGRARSGSASVAAESGSLIARMRSGSVGGLRPGRRLKRAPTAPPPTAPLPPVPPLPFPSSDSAFRRPLMHRAQTEGNGDGLLFQSVSAFSFDKGENMGMDVDGGGCFNIHEMKAT
ncbi:hypothetical protein PLICRDRAFT_178299 [Plicaturopsis crispa FD-325 SS-3]|nr:hypothetical protein PLICRDRAFT_178299 [Plicaturopsis crispa FD-325 SS-3]